MTYGVRERSVMIALAALGGECTNAELNKTYRLDLKRAYRLKLNRAGLILSQKENRTFTHMLTNLGWEYVESEMSGNVPARSGSAGGALYALLAGLKPVADSAGGLRALLINQSYGPTATVDASSQIRSAYLILAKRPQDWVMLCDLRLELPNMMKSEVDSTLKRMFLDREINLTLNDDQGSLTQRERDAAIRIGANDMHMLSMG